MPSKKRKVPDVYTQLNRVKLIRGGAAYFNLLIELIDNARESIYIQTYIYATDTTGRQVAEALKRATKRNVSVYLMADGYASQAIPTSFLGELREAGIRFRFFEPIFKSKHFYLGRRMHHKVTVIDTRYSLAGGINIADRYNDMPGKPAWLDFALYTEGEIARQLCILCWKTWKSYKRNMGLTPCEGKQLSYNIPAGERSEVRMRRNDWVRNKNEISSTYIEILRSAKSDVTILCSYFLPGQILRYNIVKAIQRGVAIKVIAAGISDVPVAKNAERWLYDWLLRNGVILYEYQKNVLHGKIAVCDNQWMTIGSYNINNISAHASIELNLDVKNALFAENTNRELQQIIDEDCVQITAEYQTRTNNMVKQFTRWLSYEFIRLTIFLFTFYFKRER
jgi:cardiolipin synthase A/B